MGRRKPFSAKKRKEQLQLTRARKRGDDVPDVASRGASGRSTPARGPGRSAGRPEAHRPGVRALESRFISMPPHYLETTRNLAFSTPLERPLPDSAALFPLDLVDRPEGRGLTVPARPKFRYGQTKKEVERNEEGVFKKWLASTRGIVDDWVREDVGDVDGWPRSPSWFETNLEVWRQLWRVVEVSAILLLLVDSRCPPVHCPPSLRAYMHAARPRKQFILVLTKADLVDHAALEGWKAWLRSWWAADAKCDADADDVQVVTVSSYDTALLYGEGRKRHRPAMDLVGALRTAHERLLTPPPRVVEKGGGGEWVPPVRTSVDWDVLAADPDPASLVVPRRGERPARRAAGQPDDAEAESEAEGDKSDEDEDDKSTPPEGDYARDPQAEPLTIGLVGQPNVGKSSLLNALLGTTRVRASKTPGKTKHFQTILWGPAREVKIVDCPGLVCPSLVPMELQAMSGILMISQIPSLPSCIYFAAEHLPLEDVFKIPLPDKEVDDVASKRTWREGSRPADAPAPVPQWTAGEIMEARALDRGFCESPRNRALTNMFFILQHGHVLMPVTAKGGRPDANRAGNGNGRVRWGFWPPGSEPERDGRGVWLANTPELEAEEKGDEEEEPSSESDDALGTRRDTGDSEASDEEEEDVSEDDSFAKQNKKSFFAALSLDDESEDEDEDEDEEDS